MYAGSPELKMTVLTQCSGRLTSQTIMARIQRHASLRSKGKRFRQRHSSMRLLRAIVIFLLIILVALVLRQGDAWHKTTAKHRRKGAALLRSVATPPRIILNLANLKPDGANSTTAPLILELVSAWAPRGVERVWELATTTQFYTEARMFRVVPNFIVQWGIAGDPLVGMQWRDRNLPDEETSGAQRKNARGTVAFAQAGPNSRTTQLFINLKDNSHLDREGFVPVGRIVEDGMEKVVPRIQDEYGEVPDQRMIHQQGNAYLQEKFPHLTYIQSVRYEAGR